MSEGLGAGRFGPELRIAAWSVGATRPEGALWCAAGCLTPEDAVDQVRRILRASGDGVVAVEIGVDGFPDVEGTLEAARALRGEVALVPWVLDDPLVCERLAALGCAALRVEDGDERRLRAIVARCAVPVYLASGDAPRAAALGLAGVSDPTSPTASTTPHTARSTAPRR